MEYELWEDAWMELVEKVMMGEYETMNEDERIWFNIRSLIDSVDDGGIMSYFYNSNADYIEETLEDLKKIGADEVVDMIMSICELFPGAKPSKDTDERNKVIDSWATKNLDYSEYFDGVDENFYEIEEELERLIEPIVKRIIKDNQ